MIKFVYTAEETMSHYMLNAVINSDFLEAKHVAIMARSGGARFVSSTMTKPLHVYVVSFSEMES